MLEAAEAAEDSIGQAVAHNCLGVALLRMRQPALAAQHFVRQLDLSDISGKFSGHLNLGLALLEVGEVEEAQDNFRDALRHAVGSGSPTAESVACGNLARSAKLAGDVDTARACLDRYLRLTNSLKVQLWPTPLQHHSNTTPTLLQHHSNTTPAPLQHRPTPPHTAPHRPISYFPWHTPWHIVHTILPV